MHYHRLKLLSLLLLLLFVVACVPNNAPLGPEQLGPALSSNSIELEVARENVTVLQGDERSPVSASEQVVELDTSQGVAVDETGRAILHFADRMALELLQGGELLQIQQFSVQGPTANATVAQSGGTLIADLTVSPDTDASLTVQTAFATINATNARFAVVRESNSPLEWVLALDVAEDGNLEIMVNGTTESVAAGQARWVTLMEEIGPSVLLEQKVVEWLENSRNNVAQPEIGEVLLSPANILAQADSLGKAPKAGQATEFGRDVQGAVTITPDIQGIFGNPGYTLEDCNSDGTQDLAITNGKLDWDFRNLLARVQAMDVTVLNRGQPGQGLLQALDPSGSPISQEQVSAAPGETQTISLRADYPYHYAQLTVADACLLGYSLTPPGAPDQPVETRPVVETVQEGAVVNILQSSAERLPQSGQLEAIPASAGQITIDGQQNDWAQSGWRAFSSVVHDSACANRYPDAAGRTDLAGQVQFAYDAQYLYVAFLVDDDGLVTYSGDDERYFLGDSPQLLLDLDLNGDFESAQLTGDDVQIDLLPDVTAPKAALWQLSNLTSSQLAGVDVDVTPTESGYFLEAALPWASLGTAPQPGDRLGLVAGISDNDTPETNAQECIISTSPQRDWRNPTTWGTVLLQP